MTVRSRLNTNARAWVSGINGVENYTARGRPDEAAAVMSAIAGLPAAFRPQRMLSGAISGGTDVFIMGALDPETAVADFGASGGRDSWQASVSYQPDRRLAVMTLVGQRSGSVVHEWGHVVDFAWARSQGDERNLSTTYRDWFQANSREISWAYNDTYQEWFAEYFRWRHFVNTRVLLEGAANRVEQMRENDRIWRTLFPFLSPLASIEQFPAATTEVTASEWKRPEVPDPFEAASYATLNGDGSATFSTTRPPGSPTFGVATVESSVVLPATRHVRVQVDVSVPAGPAVLRFRVGQGGTQSSRSFFSRVVPTGQSTIEASVEASGWTDMRLQTYLDWTAPAGNLGVTIVRPRIFSS
ncbi:hypothetical protein [Microbacterium sp. Bi128]|uniref:hypothetical protein n=1 Tax=Microbacterium sp. Bi128 TaxID=2821115 RepID=UPI001DA4F097|nr:hypothetical protein [Microbacterium sp. Bi128]CAH0246910.1 hypothetical protein SRABI128_02817 [Microbacterium sp. Bi128]